MFCRYCGEKVADDAKFCKACGKKLGSETRNNPAVSSESPVSGPQENPKENLPKDVFYAPSGRLNWYFRDYKANPSGNYIIRLEFEEDRIAQYYGVNLDAEPKKDSKLKKSLENLADVGMTIGILSGDSDIHWDASELYDRIEDMGSINNYYYYKKVTTVEKHEETGWINFKHGIDKFFLRVSPEQYDFILNEFMKRCPKAVFGEVQKRKKN